MSSREAAKECSPWRKPWATLKIEQAPKGREKSLDADFVLQVAEVF